MWRPLPPGLAQQRHVDGRQIVALIEVESGFTEPDVDGLRYLPLLFAWGTFDDLDIVDVRVVASGLKVVGTQGGFFIP